MPARAIMHRSLFLTLLPLLVVAFAQNEAAPAPATPDATFRSSSHEVLLDVVVRDKHGKFVKNLDPKQLTVYENGVLQSLASFRLVSGSEIRKQDEQQAAAMKQLSPAAQLAASSGTSTNPLRTVNLVCMIFADLNSDTRTLAFNAAKQFVNRELRPNTFIGIFGMGVSGMRQVVAPTNNREQLLAAVEQAATSQHSAGTSATNSILNGASTINPSQSGTLNDPLGMRGDMEFDTMTGLREIDHLIQLVGQLSPLPFQKTVLLIAPGITRPADQMPYWDSLIATAQKSGVTFYGLDPYGLGPYQDDDSITTTTAHSELAPSTTMLNHAASVSAAQHLPTKSGDMGSAKQMMDNMHQSDYIGYGLLSANKQAGLRELAEKTGGFLISNTNNTEPLLKRVMEEVDTHYELTYRPAIEKYDGTFRKIEVKLARADLHAQMREGYFALPETNHGALTQAEMIGLKALGAQPQPHVFDFQAQAIRFRSGKATAQYAIAFDVPIANLKSMPQTADKKHQFHFALLALVKNSKGEVVDWFSKDVESAVSDAELPTVQANNMTWEHSTDLAPGHYTVESAVVDEEANHTATNTAQLDNNANVGPVLSDVTLARRVDDLKRELDPADPFEFAGKRVIPSLSTTLNGNTQPFLYFVFYPDKNNPAKPQLHLEFWHDGHQVAARTVSVPAPDASGAVPMLVNAVNTPGNCEMKIAAVQGSESVERTLNYTIARR